MRKSTWIVALVTTLILALTVPVLAAPTVQLNGQPLVFDVPPVVESGRTLVPMRAIFEALGARITWDPDSQTISAVHPERDRYVILTLGSTTAWVDGHQVTLDVAPQAVEGRTMVPLRFISTAMGADISYDATTETVIITQAPLAVDPPGPVDPAPTETEERPDATSDEAQVLSRFTRAVAYTHLDETWLCAVGMELRFGDMAYIFAENDADYLAETLPYLAASVACWDTYEQEVLPTLPVAAGAAAAREALQNWVDLNQGALVQLQAAVAAHQDGDATERDRLFREGVQVLQAALQQEQKMLAEMDAITSSDTEFLTVSEHVYVAWLDDMVGYIDNCFYDLRMIRHLDDGDDAGWARHAADCAVGLPEVLSEETPPTPRMAALLESVLAEMAIQAEGFTALAAKLQAGPMDREEVLSAVQAIEEAWFEAQPTLDALFIYRDYGKH